MFEVFMLRNKINGKCFVSRTTDKASRVAFRCPHYNAYFRADLKKYGKGNFEVIVLDTAQTPNELDAKTDKYIEQYNSRYPNGYNKRKTVSTVLDSTKIRRLTKTWDAARHEWKISFYFRRIEYVVAFTFDESEANVILLEVQKFKKYYRYIPKEIIKLTKRFKYIPTALDRQSHGDQRINRL